MQHPRVWRRGCARTEAGSWLLNLSPLFSYVVSSNCVGTLVFPRYSSATTSKHVWFICVLKLCTKTPAWVVSCRCARTMAVSRVRHWLFNYPPMPWVHSYVVFTECYRGTMVFRGVLGFNTSSTYVWYTLCLQGVDQDEPTHRPGSCRVGAHA